MGTTLTAAAALQADSQSRLAIVNIGDSRAYTYADGQMQQLTRDHSVVQGLIEAGRVSQDQWRQHPQRHLLTRAIGMAATIEPDISLPPVLTAPGCCSVPTGSQPMSANRRCAPFCRPPPALSKPLPNSRASPSATAAPTTSQW